MTPALLALAFRLFVTEGLEARARSRFVATYPARWGGGAERAREHRREARRFGRMAARVRARGWR